MPVPNTFANATATIPLSELDANFATTITLGNTAIQLGNTVTTLNNMTMANVTISSTASAFPNNYLANSNVIVGNTTITLGSTVTSVGDLTLTNVTISSGTITANGTFNGTVANATISNTTVSNASVNSANVVGYMGIPQNSQNGAYNVVLGDAGKHIYHPTGQAAATYTFPANSNVSFTVGSAVTIINGSANNVTISLTSDTLYLSSNGATGSRTLTQWGVATAVKIDNAVWVISGSNIT